MWGRAEDMSGRTGPKNVLNKSLGQVAPRQCNELDEHRTARFGLVVGRDLHIARQRLDCVLEVWHVGPVVARAGGLADEALDDRRHMCECVSARSSLSCHKVWLPAIFVL